MIDTPQTMNSTEAMTIVRAHVDRVSNPAIERVTQLPRTIPTYNLIRAQSDASSQETLGRITDVNAQMIQAKNAIAVRHAPALGAQMQVMSQQIIAANNGRLAESSTWAANDPRRGSPSYDPAYIRQEVQYYQALSVMAGDEKKRTVAGRLMLDNGPRTNIPAVDSDLGNSVVPRAMELNVLMRNYRDQVATIVRQNGYEVTGDNKNVGDQIVNNIVQEKVLMLEAANREASGFIGSSEATFRQINPGVLPSENRAAGLAPTALPANIAQLISSRNTGPA